MKKSLIINYKANGQLYKHSFQRQGNQSRQWLNCSKSDHVTLYVFGTVNKMLFLHAKTMCVTEINFNGMKWSHCNCSFICILNFDSSCKDCHLWTDRRQSLYCTHVCFYFVVLHDVKITWCISVKTAYSCPFISNYVTNLETKKRHKYFDLGLLEHILNQTVISLFNLTEVLCWTLLKVIVGAI